MLEIIRWAGHTVQEKFDDESLLPATCWDHKLRLGLVTEERRKTWLLKISECD